MSDEFAERVEKERVEDKTKEQLEAEERQKRLWALTLVLDPVTNDFSMFPNANIKKNGQLEHMVHMASQNLLINNIVRSIVTELDTREQAKKGKGIFRK